MNYKIKNNLKVADYGSIIIESVEHYVLNGFVKCNPNLNSRSWGTTEKKTQCPLCAVHLFQGVKQLKLF